MKESLFNYRFEYENQKYIFNTNNNGLIQINNDIFTEEEREYLRVNRFWVDDNEDEIALLEREINHNIQKRQKELELTIGNITMQRHCEQIYDLLIILFHSAVDPV